MKRIFLLVLLSVASIGLLYKLQVRSSTPTSITLANVEALTEEEELPGWHRVGMIAIYDIPSVDGFFECCTDIQVACFENSGYLKFTASSNLSDYVHPL